MSNTQIYYEVIIINKSKQKSVNIGISNVNALHSNVTESLVNMKQFIIMHKTKYKDTKVH